MMITTFCHNSECHTDNQWICHKLLMSSLLFIFKSENISFYYLCMCRPHQLEQMRAIGLWEIWPESNENHQYLILISLRLDGNPLLGSKHTSYLSREPRVYPCRFFLAGVNFYRFNAKNWHFRQILREKVAFFFYRFNAKNWRFSV